MDWTPIATRIQELESERERLEAESDVLRTLQAQLTSVESKLTNARGELMRIGEELGSVRAKSAEAQRLLAECQTLMDAIPSAVIDMLDSLTPAVEEALDGRALTVESCDNRERDVRDWFQAKIDAEDRKLHRLTEKVIQAMQDYRARYPAETRDADASVAAASEYRDMLDRLRGDDLPRFERRFKELLNENTIREVANFQSQLLKEKRTIHERVDTINRSLRDIDYNPGRYMVLEPEASMDVEIRDFQRDLRACTEGALTGSDDEAYSESKFLQVKRIIERFHGRDGMTELDKRWTAKVIDVRSWFTFAASERWREDDREHEHYADSGGKSVARRRSSLTRSWRRAWHISSA